jgi:hypothetical protein
VASCHIDAAGVNLAPDTESAVKVVSMTVRSAHRRYDLYISFVQWRWATRAEWSVCGGGGVNNEKGCM